MPMGRLKELATNCVEHAAKDRPDAFIGVRFRLDADLDETVPVHGQKVGAICRSC
jgi:two-component sensor histidine kinase